LIARNHRTLEALFSLATPEWEIFRWAYDKRLTYQLAAQLDIPHPVTWYQTDRDELEQLACTFPLILKPAHKLRPSRLTWDKAWLVTSRAEMMARYDEACTMADPGLIMLQDLIPGDAVGQFSFGALCADGQPLASIVAIRRRQHPVDFGRSSSYVESTEDAEIERLGRAILGALRFNGLVEVEFKRDSRDGICKLLDINPRIWGWHTLGARGC
jgi:predicted ATP-grasp superfamily ATP-dependent carboligase